MNRYRKPIAARQKHQSARTLWTAGLALVAVILVIVKLDGGEGPSYSKIAIGVAVIFLIVRQMTRRSAGKGPKAAEPDPQSRLNLD